MRTKADRQAKRMIEALDKAIEREYYQRAQGRQISVMDIQKVFRDSRADMERGLGIGAAVQAAIDRYTVPA